ncbi:MAG: hypothetical protein QW085_05700 [Pyrobaculum sp.]
MMPVPETITRKVEAKYPIKYCEFAGRLFPGLNIERCRAGMASIVREKWAPGWEAGLKAFLTSIGAL